jgi:hypothetical protein
VMDPMGLEPLCEWVGFVHMREKHRGELYAVACLDLLDGEWESPQDMPEEQDAALRGELGGCPEGLEAGAVIRSGTGAPLSRILIQASRCLMAYQSLPWA